MKNVLLALSFLLITSNANAAVARSIIADTITNTTGGTALSVPTGSAVVSDSATQTLTNKTISGASNTISNIAAATALTGEVPVANGGTGVASLTTNNLIVGAGTSDVTFIAPGSSGNVLTSNGTVWQSTAPSGFSPTLNDSSASPQQIVAGTGLVLTGISYSNVIYVEGSGGSVTVVATPSITQCTNPGQALTIISKTSNTVTLQDEAGLAGSNLQLNGTWVGGVNSVLNLICDANGGDWLEVSRR